MKTLVIHPEDPSTDFLKPIYASIENCEVITKGKSAAYIKNAIKKADRLIFLGHGTSIGLLSMRQFPEDSLYVIDERHAELFIEKRSLIFIWCYASEYLSYHNINGFSTGNFISEPSEWSYLGQTDKEIEMEIDISNEMFVEIIADNINKCAEILYQKVDEIYGDLAKVNQIAQYNLESMRPRKLYEEILKNQFMVEEFMPFFECKKVHCFAAAPKIGITNFLCNMLIQIAKKSPVFYLSFEESKTIIESRIENIKTQFPDNEKLDFTGNIQIKKSNLREDPTKALINISDKLKKGGFTYLIIDGLNVKSVKKRKVKLRKKEMAFFQNFAESLNITILLAISIKRIIPDKKGSFIPNLQQLYYGSEIRPYMNMLLFLHRDNYYWGKENYGLTRLYGKSNLKSIDIPIPLTILEY